MVTLFIVASEIAPYVRSPPTKASKTIKDITIAFFIGYILSVETTIIVFAGISIVTFSFRLPSRT